MTDNNNKKTGDQCGCEPKLSTQGVLPYFATELFEMPNALARSGVFSVSQRLKHFDKWTPVPAWGKTKVEVSGPQLGEKHQEVWGQLMTYKRGQPITRPLFMHMNQLIEDLEWYDAPPGGAQYRKINAIVDELNRAGLRISDPKLLNNLVTLYDAFRSEAKAADPKLAAMLEARYSSHIGAIREALLDGDDYELTIQFISNVGTNKRKRRAVIELDPLAVLLFDGVNTTLINKEARKKMSTALARAVLLFIESHTGEIPAMRGSTWHGILASGMKNMRVFKLRLGEALSECEEKGYIKAGWDFYDTNDAEDTWGTVGIYPTKKLRNEYRAAMEKASKQPVIDHAPESLGTNYTEEQLEQATVDYLE